ncbi:putative O-methylsterigmatocystin oxidoreductase [Xylariaceae sp. FL1019]|nr:putative O-methylsterigmatocystin oxidoreductase [Xylariaceae sp. FL1019]
MPLLKGLAIPLVAAFAIIITIWLRATRHRSKLPLPPGPPGEPLIGHLRVIPAQRPEYQYARWAKEYGSDILHFNVLGRSIIVLNSVESAQDLLNKRGANYADRPRFVLFEVMGWGVTLTFLRWSPQFKLHRKLLQSSFTQSACKAYRPIQVAEARRAARAIIADPDSWETLLRQFSTAVILRIGFGIEVQEKDDPYIKMTLDVEEATGQGGTPAGNIVDFFPILRYLPNGASRISGLFKQLAHARCTKQYIQRLHDAPWASVEPSIRAESSTPKPSFMHTQFGRYLDNEAAGKPNEATIEDLKGAAGAIAIAGGNTTWSTIIVCILGLLQSPAARAKTRAELEEVIGVDENGDLLRLPTFEDRPQLQYLENIIRETTRWQPLSPLGVPHATLADDEYKGYHIPAGSVVYPNVRAMSRDERHYSSPEEFLPERYMPVSEGGRGEPLPDGPFGFGRRNCVGEHLALSGVYMMMSTLLATMHVRCPIDKDGNDIRPNVTFSDGLSGVPDSFGCMITPRSVKMEKLLED